jgi:aldehyde dehydrogenase (NAD+)
MTGEVESIMGETAHLKDVTTDPQMTHGEPTDEFSGIRAVFDRLQAQRWRMAQTSAQERIQRIRRLRDAVIARREELYHVLWDDYRKNSAEVEMTEILPVVGEANHAIRHLKRWMRPVGVGTPLTLMGTRSYILHEPKGVVLILAPWNYPFGLLLTPLIAAISAGNVAGVRPSSKVPHTARFLASFLADLFPPEEVSVFAGGHGVADALLDLSFDHIFFTGSPSVGKRVMAAAAKHGASVTLELGGKSPAIVDRTADVTKAAERILWAKFINAGQTCVAPDYVLVNDDRLEEFVREARRILLARYGETEEARQASPSYCRLVSGSHHDDLVRVLEAAITAGATIVFGGTSVSTERYLAPTLLTGVTENNPIMQNEIFGPILPIMSFGDIEDAIRVVRSKPKPLALYVFARDHKLVRRVLGQTTAGGTCVNTAMIHLENPNLPFGGVGNSGLGSYHGYFGFLAFSHARAVLTQGPLDILKLFYPPYTPRRAKMLDFVTRYVA